MRYGDNGVSPRSTGLHRSVNFRTTSLLRELASEASAWMRQPHRGRAGEGRDSPRDDGLRQGPATDPEGRRDEGSDSLVDDLDPHGPLASGLHVEIERSRVIVPDQARGS